MVGHGFGTCLETAVVSSSLASLGTSVGLTPVTLSSISMLNNPTVHRSTRLFPLLMELKEFFNYTKKSSSVLNVIKVLFLKPVLHSYLVEVQLVFSRDLRAIWRSLSCLLC